MKNLKKNILFVIGYVVLSAFILLDVTAQTKTKRLPQSSAKMIKCKFNDSDCFIRAANTCQKAVLTTNISMSERMWNPNVPHPTYTQTSRYEIRGMENGRCAFYSKIEKADFKYSEDYISYVMQSNKETRQQTEQSLTETRKAIKQQVGKDGICLFQTEKLVAMLNGWFPKDGNFLYSTKDFEGADCQGTLYNFKLPNQTITIK